eukprot:TRINITY_DN18915_c0_g2_i1.p2 TRINITY_DN18915_c0_g2~~TRINITY_DN18915_c0_g2_i1.p2  ORF type:complete len:111 (+),score=16.82 TRINITY_DN18915_c0_g2_i1:96-428(+)
MSTKNIRDYVTKHFRPSCIVFSSPSAQAMCETNNLSPAEMLLPFGDMSKEIISVSTAEKSSHQLKEFLIDFYDSTDYEAVPPAIQSSCRYKAITSNAPKISLAKVHSAQT